ncbi:beta-1,4-N-acetylgalactosaminyltransferase bre-4-like [Leptidea sinapis]|uniref:beta-1,4-N-acetylgalactosaminyltransferase bre-4-like n=1 Tax=Leptidea sinapis TaxID=189913 RepID=UPI00212128FD|nr:beta-1,4-N-acetylgalactosaminyltransferase bre-4-like [Leptidea sinapis]XP_050671167.1 beta-1,4-N-acetylgalactosaminyltransferase bre-4-like [Leptidea sinapis]XP_050671168.1 beta-1,4-N-acetylgalactosaminyltransferase bre-4-like [Leptidea sinapis]
MLGLYSIKNLRISTCVLIVLGCIAVLQLLLLYGSYNYKCISKEDIGKYLYMYLNPKVVKRLDKPACDYEMVYKQVHKDDWSIIEQSNQFDPSGIVNGSFVPEDCNPQLSIAILVTYRNRQSQLDIFIPFIHNFLRRQKIHYKIFVIEQHDAKLFNKGLLYNVGARQAARELFPCLVLHDVDLLPLSAANLYACLLQPRHLSASLDKFRFVLPYYGLVGGVLALTTEHFRQLNGFSNKFTGWGGEDDEFAARIMDHNLEILRFPPDMSRYTMLVHQQAPVNGQRFRLMSETVAAQDGLNSMHYRSVSVSQHPLFTLIRVVT